MNRIVFNNLCLLCLIFGLTLNAKKECIESNGAETNKKMVRSKDLDSKISQIIKTAFQAKNVNFSVPKKMEPEFNARKQAILDNLNQKMSKLKIDKVYLPEVTKLVEETFDIFIDRIKYMQLSEEIRLILSNIKKDPNAPNCSSLFN